MKMYRQEKLIEKLLKFRWKKYGFNLIKVECYDRYDGDRFMCRVECFKGGKGIKYRVMKHEAPLDEKFVVEAERRLEGILTSVD
ncbi:hypothetical protein [Ulvibacterium marinum]|uniref:Uncharacterized protein n=1 Tax=Ulvibacterium marinum TaxID=2419782 RepID=A0A3B0CHV0_9FLAO|nr:hypothetical protein [Ulvibacterium marinum]RKN83356.1 hypothetical protein D7Z94_05900 [Ulvibacterium marinum]